MAGWLVGGGSRRKTALLISNIRLKPSRRLSSDAAKGVFQTIFRDPEKRWFNREEAVL